MSGPNLPSSYDLRALLDDPETARLYRTAILPDEYRHAAIGQQALLLLADTPARRARAAEACREMNRRVFEAYAAHRRRADRGG